MQSSKKIARREKKAFLSEQYKEIEENNRMGKTRNLFKNVRDTKRTFHAKMGTITDKNSMNLRKMCTITDKNSMNLTKTEDIKKSWQEDTEELYKKIS